MAAPKKSGPMRVTAPLVTARTAQGDRVVYLYHGDVVPDGLSQESLDHLKDLGFVEVEDN